MILIILLVSVIVLIVGLYIMDEATGIIGVLGVMVSVIVAGVLLGSIINSRTLDDKIELYQAQNNEIEARLSETVSQYMQYETDTYRDLKGESCITLVSLYPELKADELISKQCELYIANNENITKLKEEKINVRNYKWWLYFGGGK